MIEIVGMLTTFFAIAGVVLNNRKLRLCFILWFFSNGLSLIIHLKTGILSLAIRDFVFFILSIEGWYKWGIK